MIELTFPEDINKISLLKAGDAVSLSGTIFTARDCAHKRLANSLLNNEGLPIPLKDITIYYAGPCPAPKGKASGSCGPTTSARVDVFTPLMLDNGVKGMIGKGGRSVEVVASMIKNKCVYFAAIGGAGAIYGNNIVSSKIVAFPDLLSEAIYELNIKDFPLIVAIDSDGNTIY